MMNSNNQLSIHHVGVHCKEADSLKKFYENVLGCHLKKKFRLSERLHHEIFDGSGSVMVFVYSLNEICFEVFVSQENEMSFFHGCAHVCLEVNDKKDLVSKCRKNNVSVNVIEKDGKQLLFIADFSGNLFEIKQKS